MIEIKKKCLKGVLTPCGHVCSCDACGLRLNVCPLCRVHIVQKINVVGMRPPLAQPAPSQNCCGEENFRGIFGDILVIFCSDFFGFGAIFADFYGFLRIFGDF